MAQQIASLFASIGADTSGLDKALKGSKSGLEQTNNSMNKFAATAKGNLRSSVSEFSATLKGATPQNLAYAATFAGIEEDFKSGKISINDAKTAIANLEDAMGPAEQQTKSFGATMKDIGKGIAIAGVAIGATIMVVKKAFEFAKEIASLERVEGKFDRLSTSIGTTSDALLDDLKKATKGTVSDMELVASATGFM